MTTALLSSLEKQLEVLKGASAPIAPPIINQTEAPVTMSREDLRNLVKEMMLSEKQEVVQLVSKEYTLLEAVNLALTGEEQQWLIKEDVIKGIANFMATAEGQEITKQFMINYRSYYESKT
jgi:hypothetical protein